MFPCSCSVVPARQRDDLDETQLPIADATGRESLSKPIPIPYHTPVSMGGGHAILNTSKGHSPPAKASLAKRLPFFPQSIVPNAFPSLSQSFLFSFSSFPHSIHSFHRSRNGHCHDDDTLLDAVPHFHSLSAVAQYLFDRQTIHILY